MPRTKRPAVPSCLAPWVESFELSLRAECRSERTVAIYADAARWLTGWLGHGAAVGMGGRAAA